MAILIVMKGRISVFLSLLALISSKNAKSELNNIAQQVLDGKTINCAYISSGINIISGDGFIRLS